MKWGNLPHICHICCFWLNSNVPKTNFILNEGLLLTLRPKNTKNLGIFLPSLQLGQNENLTKFLFYSPGVVLLDQS